MLNLVPFARSWRKVAHRNGQTQVIGQCLPSHLPQPRATAVAPTSVGRYQQLASLRIGGPSHLLPPAANSLRGKVSRVMIDADAHPAVVVRRIVDPVGDHLAQLLVLKVVYPHFLGLSFGLPFAAGILEI